MNESNGRKVLGVDPGTMKTAYALYDARTKALLECGHIPNHEFLEKLKTWSRDDVTHMAIEMMASMGMAVGQSTFETAVWIGRFVQEWLRRTNSTYEFIYRLDEKLHLCGDARAKDPNIRQAIMDRFGGTREIAIGKKKAPGPLFDVSNDMWSALAICLTATEVPEDARRGHGTVRL